MEYMLERIRQASLSERNIVFLDQGGKLVRLFVDENTQIASLIQERESLGERVVVITDASEAKELIENQQKQEKPLDEFFLGRF